MKKKWMSNWGLKLISIVLALMLWLVVVNVNDPVITKTIKNIPVKILNENLIDEAGQMYSVLDASDTVTITVKAKRSVVESLSSSDFKATADMAERISEGSVPIRVEALKRVNDIDDIILLNNTVKIEVLTLAHKQVPVELTLSGKTADGYTVGSSKVNPETVTVEGPETVVAKISKVGVTVDINGASEDLELVEKGEYLDQSGNIIKHEALEGDISQISASVHLLHTKSIDLNLTTEGEPADDYRCQDIQYTPTTVTIAGEPEDLAKIHTLVIPSSELNIEGATDNVEKEINVAKYLPSNLVICNENEQKIKVTLVIKQLDGKEFKIQGSSVDVLNTPTGLDTVMDSSKTISVIVKGTSEDLNNLSAKDIKLSVDVKGKEEGAYNLQADVTVPSGYVVMNKPMVSVVLQKTVEESEEPEQSQSPGVPSETQIQTYNPQKSQKPEETVEPHTPSPDPTPTVEESVQPSEDAEEPTE